MEFSERQAEFDHRGAVLLGVSPDSVASHKKFAEKQGITVDLLSDAGHEVLEAYGAWGLKKSYGKEYHGVVRSSVLIDPSGDIRYVWAKAKSAGHAAEVLEKLKELQG